jgi:hypothetical protein
MEESHIGVMVTADESRVGDIILNDVEKLLNEMRNAEWTECITIYSKLSDQKNRYVLILRPKLLEHFNDRLKLKMYQQMLNWLKSIFALNFQKKNELILLL